MKSVLYLCLSVGIVLSFISCKCQRIDCILTLAAIRIQAIKADTILLKGSNPVLTEDEITLRSATTNSVEEQLFIDTIDGVINLSLFRNEIYILKIGQYLEDTISADISIDNDFASCCSDITTNFVTISKGKICEGNCEEVIRLEL